MLNIGKENATLTWQGGDGAIFLDGESVETTASSPFELKNLNEAVSYTAQVKNKAGESEKIQFNTKDYDILVNSKGNADYKSVVEAAKNAESGMTIKVMPGTYSGTIKSQGKMLNIIGTDRATCILKSTDGRYEYPVIDFGYGKLENLTIVAEYVSGESHEIDSNTTGAYAIHSDDPSATNKKTEIKNCVVRSDFFPALGCGLRQNYVIDLNSSTLINNQDNGRGGYINQGTLGAVFVHDVAADNITDQNINITDCTLKSNKAYALCIHDLGRANSKASILAINNTLTSSASGSAIWFRGKDAWTNTWELDAKSKGNNDALLNK